MPKGRAFGFQADTCMLTSDPTGSCGAAWRKGGGLLRLLILLAAVASPALAHVPVLAMAAKTAQAPYQIEKAENSKAIYAILDGDADYYRLEETKAFDAYIGILAPKLETCELQHTFSFEVLNAEMEVIDSRDGTEFNWWPWFEKFGGQWYWVGPEIGHEFVSTAVYPAGVYYIRVFNDGNQGKYVLATGDKESFGLRTLLTLPRTMRQIEALFWDERDCP